jgi:mRNA interferase RelE/StbE
VRSRSAGPPKPLRLAEEDRLAWSAPCWRWPTSLAREARELTGDDDVFRIRVGRFRVLYSVSHARLVILVLKIGHRKDVCR